MTGCRIHPQFRARGTFVPLARILLTEESATMSTRDMLPRSTFGFLAMEIASAKELSFGLRKIARNVRRRLWIASPFVGGWSAAKCLIDTVWQSDPNVEMRLLTDIENKGWLDPTTIREIANFGAVKHLRGIHAKIFIADDHALVTSANLTRTAFAQRHEIGIFLSNNESAPVVSIFEKWWEKAANPPRGWIKKLQALAPRGGQSEEPSGTPFEKLYPLPKPPQGGTQRRTSSVRTPRSEAARSLLSRKQLDSLFDNEDDFFVCNTDRRHTGHVAERLMRQRGYAAAWEDFSFPSRMREVESGNAILMYANGDGIIAIGRAKSSCEVLQPGSPKRLRKGNTREWRVPVNWLVWDDANPFQDWTSPPPTFFKLRGKKHRRLRDRVRRHFGI